METKEQIPNSFQFYVPVSVEKASKKDEWRIKGIASTGDKDEQNETVMQNGLDLSYLKSGMGFFNYDHGKNPDDVIGQVTDAKQTAQGLLVEGYLFKEQPKAKSIHNIMRSLNKGSEKRVKMSIEGKVLKRKGNKILRAKVTNVALTFNPINTSTYTEFVKSFVDPQELSEGDNSPASPDKDGPEVSSSAPGPFALLHEKMDQLVDMVKGMSTGNYNAPPSELSGGAAMAKESLDKKEKKLRKYDKKKVKKIYDKAKKSHPDLTKEELVEIIEKVYDRIQ